MAVKLSNSSAALEDIRENYPDRILERHEPMDLQARHASYLRTVYGGPSQDDITSVSVDVAFCGDPPRFIIENTVYSLHRRLGSLKDEIGNFSGVQKRTAKKYL